MIYFENDQYKAIADRVAKLDEIGGQLILLAVEMLNGMQIARKVMLEIQVLSEHAKQSDA